MDDIYQQALKILSMRDERAIREIRKKSCEVLREENLFKVHLRGLIEFSNICSSNCFYCGIRKDNNRINRYLMPKDQIVKASLFAAENGLGSIVLQSGERQDPLFIDFVEDLVGTIKKETRSQKLQKGLGITLCIGEQTKATYRRLFQAGAHRYLLRVETSSKRLFQKLHPHHQSYEARIACLDVLRDIGYQVGTGVMIGLPGQSISDLAEDIVFFKEKDVDMIGMGPYLPHQDAPLKVKVDFRENLRRSLLMIAACRTLLRNVNIAATTALQVLHPQGREKGLSFGANIIMPQLTPQAYRKDYLLYGSKPCIEEDGEKCISCIINRIEDLGREIAFNEWGDAPHYFR